MKKLEKLIEICNTLGEVRGKKLDCQKLKDNFTKSFDYPDEKELNVFTDKNNSVYLSIKEIRTILMGGEPRNFPSKGRVDHMHALIALLDWDERYPDE